jgi:hypothetical protein
VSEEKSSKSIPWWGKMIIGGAGMFAVIKWTPIIEILNLFFYICLIPIGLLCSVGILSDGAAEGLSGGWNRTVEELNNRVESRVTAAKNKAA